MGDESEIDSFSMSVFSSKHDKDEKVKEERKTEQDEKILKLEE